MRQSGKTKPNQTKPNQTTTLRTEIVLAKNLKEASYGVEVSSGNDTNYYLGEDEILWDWANAPVGVPFTDSLAEVPLPEGYVLMEEEGEERLVKGSPASGAVTTLVSSDAAFDDLAHVLTCSMTSVSRREFKAAGLSDERIIRSVAF
jgi:hypothetical protein